MTFVKPGHKFAPPDSLATKSEIYVGCAILSRLSVPFQVSLLVKHKGWTQTFVHPGAFLADPILLNLL